MPLSEAGNAEMRVDAVVIRGGGIEEAAHVGGRFEVECFAPDGKLKWRDTIENTVVTVGKNLAMDTYLAGAAYTVVGPFMGLVSGTSFTATAATDTMASHAGWLECGGANLPTYTAPRKTCAWSPSAGASKALSAALSFAMTGAGPVQGAFIVFGTGALSTIDNTAGVLYSAGAFTGGAKTVGSGDTLNVSYTATI
jgi:hypothetical protein